MEGTYSIELLGIEKSFASVSALRGVDFRVAEGEIHALIGENGAGKSTLMNILGGVVQKNSGHIRYFGQAVDIPDPAAARKLKIAFIHQELNLIPTMSVFQNIFIGDERNRNRVFLDDATMIAETEKILQKLDIRIDPQEMVSELSTSYKQVVEIAKAIRMDARILIMDEPTTSLTEKEIEKLFVVMRTLKNHGVSVIFISHKLKEVLTVCDSYTVLRDGLVAGSGSIAAVDEEQLVGMMVGRSLVDEVYYKKRALGEAVLEVQALTLEPYFRNVDFTVRRGEIVGFTGLLGDGRSELFEAIFGYRKVQSGRISITGKPVSVRSTMQGLQNRIGLVPKNRKDNSILWNLSVRENITISSLKDLIKNVFINRTAENRVVRQLVAEMNIHLADSGHPITSLSGGNQQKAILARWLNAKSQVLILDNPTQGIDVGAKSEIYHYLVKLAEQGLSIIILSSEIEEIHKICDRVLVLFQGEVAATLDREGMLEETIMLYSTGVKNDYSSR